MYGLEVQNSGPDLRLYMIFGDKIHTPRLVLRRVDQGDIPQLIDWSKCQVAHGDFLTPENLSEAKCQEQLDSGTLWNRENRLFIIEKKDGSLIGTLHFWVRSECKQCGVIALKISNPQERSKGFGTEAQKYVIINLFDQHKLSAVEMYTDINNRAQQRCLEKLGFELVETVGYEDHHVARVGHLFRLDAKSYSNFQYYQYHYE